MGDTTLRVSWDRTTGSMVGLALDDGKSWVSRPVARPLGVYLKGQGAIQSFELVRIDEEARGSTIRKILRWEAKPLQIQEEVLIVGGLMSRRVKIENRGEETLQLVGIRLTVPGLAHGDPDITFLSAPGNNVRPRLSLARAARERAGRYSQEFAPTAKFRFGLAMEDAPDSSSGLLALHDPDARETLLTWYWSETEAATPGVEGNGDAISLFHDVHLAAWLPPGSSVEGGTQYIMLHRGNWDEALQAYRDRLPAQGLIPIYGPEPPEWVRRAAVYETHPGLFGGFRGLTAEIPRIAAMGFNVLYLMPIWEYDNRSGRPWDGNWTGSGSPYAIRDYEKFDPTLGDENDFGQMVEKAHAHGMKVLLDFVAQGCARDSRYVKEHPEWLERDENGEFFSSHGWNDTFSFDWANPIFQEYMLDWALKLAAKHGVDGYRVDAPHGKEPNWDRNLFRRHASATNLGVLRLLEWLQVELKRLGRDKAMLCEVAGPVFVKSHDFSYDYPACAQFFTFLVGLLSAQELCTWLREHAATLPKGAVRVCFTETHDTRSMTPPSYALRGSDAEKALLSAMVMAGFVPMVWSGQERGEEGFYRDLLRVWREEPSLRSGLAACGDVMVADPSDRPVDDPPVLTFVRGEGEDALMGVISFFPEKRTFEFRFPAKGLGLEPDRLYQIEEVMQRVSWDEYGRDSWSGRDLASGVALTPEPFQPYFLRLEAVG